MSLYIRPRPRRSPRARHGAVLAANPSARRFTGVGFPPNVSGIPAACALTPDVRQFYVHRARVSRLFASIETHTAQAHTQQQCGLLPHVGTTAPFVLPHVGTTAPFVVGSSGPGAALRVSVLCHVFSAPSLDSCIVPTIALASDARKYINRARVPNLSHRLTHTAQAHPQ